MRSPYNKLMSLDSLAMLLPDSGATEVLGAATCPRPAWSGCWHGCRNRRRHKHPAPAQAQAPNAGTGTEAGAASGAVIHLRGELGSGKTPARAVSLHALGVTGTVRSPTYTLVDTYSTPKFNCVHVDLYRLLSGAEVEELGLRDMTGPGYLMLIEWPEKGGCRGSAAESRPGIPVRGGIAGGHAARVRRSGPRLAREAVTLDTSLSPYVSNLT